MGGIIEGVVQLWGVLWVLLIVTLGVGGEGVPCGSVCDGGRLEVMS